jgi:hypothetical protein
MNTFSFVVGICAHHDDKKRHILFYIKREFTKGNKRVSGILLKYKTTIDHYQEDDKSEKTQSKLFSFFSDDLDHQHRQKSSKGKEKSYRIDTIKLCQFAVQMERLDAERTFGGLADKIISQQKKDTQRDDSDSKGKKENIYPDFFVFYPFCLFEEDKEGQDSPYQDPYKMEFVSIRAQQCKEFFSICRYPTDFQDKICI